MLCMNVEFDYYTYLIKKTWMDLSCESSIEIVKWAAEARHTFLLDEV